MSDILSKKAEIYKQIGGSAVPGLDKRITAFPGQEK
jgi:hypothetical protein